MLRAMVPHRRGAVLGPCGGPPSPIRSRGGIEVGFGARGVGHEPSPNIRWETGF
jgi:hypothetical protein